jgi:hypothetical protein
MDLQNNTVRFNSLDLTKEEKEVNNTNINPSQLTQQINNLNISNNILQPNQLSAQFDFYKDFELREMMGVSDMEPNLKPNTDSNIESNIQSQINLNDVGEHIPKSADLENMINSLPYINDNLRSNIILSMELYKKLNNFDHNYIHEYFNGLSDNK